MALSLKHQAFVDEYLKDRHGTKAALAAGYSPNGAAVTATRLLKNPKIQDAIVARTEKVSALVDVTVASVLQKLEDVYAKAVAANQFSAAVSAAKALGEYLAMFTQVHRVTLEPSEREARLHALFDRN